MNKRIIQTLLLLLMTVSMIASYVAPVGASDVINRTESITVQEEIVEQETVEEHAEVKEKQIFIEVETLEETAMRKKSQEMMSLSYIEDNMTRFIKYKEVSAKYECILGSYESIYDYFTDEEIYFMQRCVETECYQRDFMSKVNVSSVILNRYQDGRWGDNLKDIVTYPNQFAYTRTEITEDTKLAIEFAFVFGDTTKGALFFHSGKKTKTFCRGEYIFSDNAIHHFYANDRKGENNLFHEFRFKVNLDTINKINNFIEKVNQFDSDIDVLNDLTIVDGKSLVGLHSLDLSKDTYVRIITDNMYEFKRFANEMEEFQ